MKDRARVLLIWPGGLFGGGANFGVPQLLMIASAIRRASDAIVEVVDFDMERAFGPIDLARVVAGGYDLVGISCYSSYDYLKVMAIGARLRELLPRAWLVTGAITRARDRKTSPRRTRRSTSWWWATASAPWRAWRAPSRAGAAR